LQLFAVHRAAGGGIGNAVPGAGGSSGNDLLKRLNATCERGRCKRLGNECGNGFYFLIRINFLKELT
jgi:hypothetical protein